MNWVELAEAVNTLKKSPEMRQDYPTRKAFWDGLGQNTGYSANALQRMESTLVRIREIEKEDRKALKENLGLKKWREGALLNALDHFPKAEIFARIHKLDPAEAGYLLQRMQSERMSVNRMKEILRDISNSNPDVPKFVTPGQKPLDARQRFSVIDEHKNEIYTGGEVSIYFRRYKFPFVSADAVATKSNEDGGIEFIDAIQLIAGLRKKSEEGFRDFLSGVDFRTSFFRHLWIFLADPIDVAEPDGSDPIFTQTPLDHLTQAVDELGIERIGIVAYDEGDGIKIIRRPKGDEKPKRYQSVLNEVMRQGLPDFGSV